MKRGFTLVELLVVIGILGVLMGLAVVAGRSMKKRSQQTACLSKLKGIGGGLEMYLADNGDSMPVMEIGRDSKLERDVPVLETVLAVYLSPEDFHCPADHEHHEKSGCSYFWNTILNGKQSTQLDFMGQVGMAQIPLVYDKEDFHPNGVNILYADQSASREVRFNVEK